MLQLADRSVFSAAALCPTSLPWRRLIVLDRLRSGQVRDQLDVASLGGAPAIYVQQLWCICAEQFLTAATELPASALLILAHAADRGVDAVIRDVRRRSAAPLVVLTPGVDSAALVALLDAGVDMHVDLTRDDAVIHAFLRAILRRSGVQPLAQADRGLASANTTRGLTLPDDMVPEYDPVPQLNSAPRHIGQLVLYPLTRRAEWQGRTARLTPTEFALLEALASAPGEVCSHQQLHSTVWGDREGDVVQYLRVYVRELREKLEQDPSAPTLIVTVPRQGYCLQAESEAWMEANLTAPTL